MCVYVKMEVNVWSSGDNSVELVLSYLSVGSGIKLRLSDLCGKHLTY